MKKRDMYVCIKIKKKKYIYGESQRESTSTRERRREEKTWMKKRRMFEITRPRWKPEYAKEEGKANEKEEGGGKANSAIRCGGGEDVRNNGR